MKLKIGIIDYGAGNLIPLSKVLSKLGFKPILSSQRKELNHTDLLILPGVGAYKPAMEVIKKKGLNDLIYEMVDKKKPIIGICLGMQLLGRSSLEGEHTKGLGLIPEDVYPLAKNLSHIGWNSAKIIKKDPVLKNLNDLDFYFNHSYAFKPKTKYTIFETKFHSINFTSILRKNNIFGLQFHPEKSQERGLSFLSNLVTSLYKNA